MKMHNSSDWWLGAADLAAAGIMEGTTRIGRVHLAIADESFNILARIPLTRPVSEPVRTIHHGICRVCYGSVATAARVLQRAAESRRAPAQMKLITQKSPTEPSTRV